MDDLFGKISYFFFDVFAADSLFPFFCHDRFTFRLFFLEVGSIVTFSRFFFQGGQRVRQDAFSNFYIFAVNAGSHVAFFLYWPVRFSLFCFVFVFVSMSIFLLYHLSPHVCERTACNSCGI